MAGPWEDYAPQSSGKMPWEDYAPVAPVEKSFLQKVADYASGTVQNFSDPQQWKDALWRGTHDAAGRSIGEQLMHPELAVQALGDQARIAQDTLTYGGSEALRNDPAGIEAAQQRAGTAGTGMQLAAASALPSMAASKLAPGAGIVKRGLGYGAEGATHAAASAVGHGERDPWTIAMQAGKGALWGAGGGAAFGKTAPSKPDYATDLALAESAKARRGTTPANLDIRGRARKTQLVGRAQQGGREGFANLLSGMDKTQKSLRNLGGGGFTPSELAKMQTISKPKVARHAEPVGTAIKRKATTLTPIVAATQLLSGNIPGAIATSAGGAASYMGGSKLANIGARARQADPRAVEDLAAGIRSPTGGTPVPPDVARELLARLFVNQGRI